MMSPRLRDGVTLAVAAVAAIVLGVQIAHGELLWPAVATSAAVAAVLARALRLEIDVVAVGLLVFGYLAGGRGFAQLSLVPGLPVLPAEFVLALALAWRIVRCAFERRLPWSGSAFDWVLLAWLVLGGARMLFDVRSHGMLAIRDFATVYYALFFFLVAQMARDPRSRRFLVASFTAGVLGLAVTYPLSRAMPDVFLRELAINGLPVVYHKDDLVQTFFAAGGVLLFHAARGTARMAVRLVALGFVLAAIGSDVRAAMLGAVVALLALAAAGRWRFALLQSALASGALAALVLISLVPGQDWAGDRVADITARATTLFKLDGSEAHREVKGYKIDNNRFRLVWWRTVATEVALTSPAFGLGFGYDLSDAFRREYDQELGEEFMARSPHSIAVTVLGRLGLIGALIWAAFCVAFGRAAWRALRGADDAAAGQWAALGVILVSAFFGVVLEGPMGAVPFWVLLGLAVTPQMATPAGGEASTLRQAEASARLPANEPSV